MDKDLKSKIRMNFYNFFSPHWLRSSRHFQHTWLLFNFFRQVMQPHLNDTLKRPLTCFLHSFWNMFQPFDLQRKCLYVLQFVSFFKGQEKSKVNCNVFKSSKNERKIVWRIEGTKISFWDFLTFSSNGYSKRWLEI